MGDTQSIEELVKERYEERCGIYQYDGGYTRQEAELWAFKDVLHDYIRSQHNAAFLAVQKMVE